MRAYATNAIGTAYGSQVTFTTTSPNAVQDIIANNGIQVYPNPFNTDFNVKVRPNLVHAAYSVFNGTGKIVESGFLEGETTVLHLENIPNGIYNLKIQGEHSIKISKR